MPRTHLLSSETIEDYQNMGAVVLRGVFNAQEIQTLEKGIEHNLAHLSPLVQVASQADDPGRFVEDFCTWQSNPDYIIVILWGFGIKHNPLSPYSQMKVYFAFGTLYFTFLNC
jgi:hypothetical protein